MHTLLKTQTEGGTNQGSRAKLAGNFFVVVSILQRNQLHRVEDNTAFVSLALLLFDCPLLSVPASFISHSSFSLFTMTCHIINILLKGQNIHSQRNHAHTDLSNADVLNDATQSWNCGNTH